MEVVVAELVFGEEVESEVVFVVADSLFSSSSSLVSDGAPPFSSWWEAEG